MSKKLRTQRSLKKLTVDDKINEMLFAQKIQKIGCHLLVLLVLKCEINENIIRPNTLEQFEIVPQNCNNMRNQKYATKMRKRVSQPKTKKCICNS